LLTFIHPNIRQLSVSAMSSPQAPHPSSGIQTRSFGADRTSQLSAASRDSDCTTGDETEATELSRDESKLDRRIARLLDNDKPISKYDRVQRAVYLEAQITEAYETLAQEDLVPAVPEDDLGLRVRLHVRTAIDNIARNTGEIVERDSDCVKRLRYAIWEQMRAVRGVSVEDLKVGDLLDAVLSWAKQDAEACGAIDVLAPSVV
jgi:hypothetical protein